MFALLAVRIQRRLERTLELDRLEPLGPIKPGSDGQHQQHQQHDQIFINKNNTKNTINSTKSSSTWPPALEALGPLPPVEPAASTLNAKSVSLAVLPVALVETPAAKGVLHVIVHRTMIAIKMITNATSNSLCNHKLEENCHHRNITILQLIFFRLDL